MVLSKQQLGELVKEARNFKSKQSGQKYTQAMLAEELNISRSYLGDIENGRIYPNYVILNEIAEICGVPLNFFSEGNQALENRLTNPDIRRIARASKNLTSEQTETIRKVAQSLFPEAFKDDENS